MGPLPFLRLLMVLRLPQAGEQPAATLRNQEAWLPVLDEPVSCQAFRYVHDSPRNSNTHNSAIVKFCGGTGHFREALGLTYIQGACRFQFVEMRDLFCFR